MKVKFIEEKEDGSANIQLDDISAEELRILVQEGLIAILKREIEKQEEKDES